MTTANKITIVRILLIPAFVMMALYYGQSVQSGEPQEWQRFAAIIIFLLAAASDGLDGYVARHYNQRSTGSRRSIRNSRRCCENRSGRLCSS